jgi:hypothetical protein
MTLQEQHNVKRKQYLSNELTHAEFYLWLGSAIGATADDLPVSVDRLRSSKDEHFNDIPLHKWDMRDLRIRDKAFQSGMRLWSLSDTVCVLKAIARQQIQVAA